MHNINNVTSYTIIKTFELNGNLFFKTHSLYITEKKQTIGGEDYYAVFYNGKRIASIDAIQHGRLFSENFIDQCK